MTVPDFAYHMNVIMVDVSVLQGLCPWFMVRTGGGLNVAAPVIGKGLHEGYVQMDWDGMRVRREHREGMVRETRFRFLLR